MSDNQAARPISINKYPNRRYYDTLNSRHVTLQDLYDLIVSGKDICVTDTRTGEDLTNLVLMQILLERDHLKLDLFPSSLMHMMIRSSRNSLRTTLDRFFGPFLHVMAAGQKQWDQYLRQSMKGSLLSPMDWTSQMLEAFAGQRKPLNQDAGPFEHHSTPANIQSPAADELEELRSTLDSLRRRISQIEGQQALKPPRRRRAAKPKPRR
jgi:polyhydroxyalkanoate synthesis repressor PhaR